MGQRRRVQLTGSQGAGGVALAVIGRGVCPMHACMHVYVKTLRVHTYAETGDLRLLRFS
jgi:hypothetical protein